jgi:hypothetical protein
VRGEAAHDQQTMRICIEEIARCQRVTPRPNFIILLGDGYGWRPLPFAIPADEFEEIEARGADEADGVLLRQWYRRDDNAVPPVYDLQPRRGGLIDAERWEGIERRLHVLLRGATGDLPVSDVKSRWRHGADPLARCRNEAGSAFSAPCAWP